MSLETVRSVMSPFSFLDEEIRKRRSSLGREKDGLFISSFTDVWVGFAEEPSMGSGLPFLVRIKMQAGSHLSSLQKKPKILHALKFEVTSNSEDYQQIGFLHLLPHGRQFLWPDIW